MNWALIKKIADFITFPSIIAGIWFVVHVIDTHRKTADEIQSSKEWLRYDSAEILWLRGKVLGISGLGPEPQMADYIENLRPSQLPTTTDAGQP